MAPGPVPLPADDLVAIYDTSIKILYLYARGKWHSAKLISFNRLVLEGGLKYAFEAFAGDPDTGPIPTEPTENRFAEGLHIDLTSEHFHPEDVLIETREELENTDDPKIKTNVVPIVYIPIIQ
ncbi:hypothetical protein A1O3_05888 [Capronia epimyces CBS 606.96]|uniref:Uncharacterized protein n=1 Tax=Capronia epimyces CBS 606.96 TaxID=1182542 RepID=W9XY79_9EURO|nr:uncharacterized protein A1O3_05888 [Capronia epimyces CBS 606.96]EXJ85213.1 hypothetical protein A1O3_05888 [Capronia epimyces CBS 606.96]